MGGEMTPLPPACVQAVQDTIGRMGAITCEDVARAVLDAFVAGEGGPWKAFLASDGASVSCADVNQPHVLVRNSAGIKGHERTDRVARRIAVVLNYWESPHA